MDVHLVFAVSLFKRFACDLVRSHSCFFCQILVLKLCFSAVVSPHNFPLVLEGLEVPAGMSLVASEELSSGAVRRISLVGDTGFEPVTSSVSGKRATTAPIAQFVA